MADNPNKFTKFWNELKRRKVLRVALVYASTAFILLQLLDILLDPLHLPEWVMTFFVVLLLVGFPIAVIFAWIFDMTPTGIEVTKSEGDKTSGDSYGMFSRKYIVFDIIIGVLLIVVIILAYPKIFRSNSYSDREKSIAILPFENISNDSTNANFISGLREDILTKLQNISDLRVASSTSGNKYKDSGLSVPEIGKELDVSYILEGTGQKTGNQVKLNLQLIVAEDDEQIWAEPFIRDLNEKNLYEIQEEVALAVANMINAEITPEESERIKKVPTQNPVAQEWYYKGLDLLNRGGKANINQAISCFKKAIIEDEAFALAYAKITRAYSDLITYNRFDDIIHNYNDDNIREQIYEYANYAYFHDPNLPESYFAKAIEFEIKEKYKLAEKFLLKALELNPNYYDAYQNLAYFYSTYRNNPDAEKFVEYQLMALQLDVPSDSTGQAQLRERYLDLGRSFRAIGFFEEAMKYFKKAREITPNYARTSVYMSELILDDTDDYKDAVERLHEIIKLDSTSYIQAYRICGLNYYNIRDFPNALKWYEKWLSLQGSDFSSYRGRESGRLAVVLSEVGQKELAKAQIESILETAESFFGFFQNIYMLQYYSLNNDIENAIVQLQKCAQEEAIAYSRIRLYKDEPVYDNIRDLPEFKQMLSTIEEKFWETNERVKANLTEKGLL